MGWKFGVAAGCAAAIALWTGQAAAATVTLTTTLDVTQGAPNSPTQLAFGGTAFSPFSIDLSPGDTVAWTVSFLPGQTMSFNTLRFVAPALNAADHILAQTAAGPTVTMEAFGLGGVSLGTATGSGSSGGIDALFTVFGLGPPALPYSGPLTVTAFSFSIPVGSVGGPESRTFNGARLTVADVTSVVPEPAGWALMIVGLGLAGAALRRQNGYAGAS